MLGAYPERSASWINAARENVPMLFTAGRSPLTEEGMAGARDVYIHWAQEMFDQAGMVREIVKWDYELRNGQQLETVVDRALAVATSAPQGPVLSVVAARGAGVAAARLHLRHAGSPPRRPVPTKRRSTRPREFSPRRKIR
jgi:acetolactate synthase I/II/III large subunit